MEVAPSQPEGTDRLQAAFSAHYPGLVRHVAYLLGDAAAAEDIAQEAFLRLLRRPPPAGGDPGGWLRVTGTRLAYNFLRAAQRRRRREELAVQRTEPAVDLDAALSVRAALATLPPRDRLVLLLRGQGASYAEIGEAIGMAPGSVGTVLARATRRLRTAFQGEGEDPRGASR